MSFFLICALTAAIMVRMVHPVPRHSLLPTEKFFKSLECRTKFRNSSEVAKYRTQENKHKPIKTISTRHITKIFRSPEKGTTGYLKSIFGKYLKRQQIRLIYHRPYYNYATRQNLGCRVRHLSQSYCPVSTGGYNSTKQLFVGFQRVSWTKP